jgi:hypothetical protein
MELNKYPYMDTDITNMPIELLYKHPVVQELLDKLDSKENSIDLEKDVKLPYVIKGKTLMSPGVWNNLYYTPEEIQSAYNQTAWDKKENRALFLDHLDGNNGRMGSLTWVGEIKNPRMDGDTLKGDLIVVDKPTAIKLAYGAKMGISPRVGGVSNNGRMTSFRYENFSVVINPAIKTAYINNSQEEAKPDFNVTVSENKIDNLEVNNMSDEPVKVEAPAPEAAKLAVEEVKPEPKVEEPKVEAPKEMAKEEKPVEEKKPEVAMMSDDQVGILAEKIISAMMSKMSAPKEEMKCAPKEEKMAEEPKPVATAEMAQKDEITVLKQTIQELSERLNLAESKLNEPAKVAVKTEELSMASGSVNIDSGFLSMLEGI